MHCSEPEVEYEPPEHAAQSVMLAATLLEAVPAGHGVQLELPTPEKKPEGHCWHVALVVAPSSEPKQPAGHSEHSATPPGLNVPGAHRSGSIVLMVLHECPAGQGKHELAPLEFWNVAAGQGDGNGEPR